MDNPTQPAPGFGATATDPTKDPQPSKIDQIDQLAQIGLAVASKFVPAGVGAELAGVAGLEPVVSHLVLAFLHLFRHKAAVAQAS